MVSAQAGGVRVRLASLVAVVGLLLGGLLGTPPAQAAEPIPLVSITLDSMKPAVPDRNGEITLTGTVKNITDQPLVQLKAIFWRNQAPITDREGFDQALASASNDPLGTRKIEVFQELFTPTDPALDPGETAEFSLTARIADLELAPTDGVYLMGIHVLRAGTLFAIGRARVFVPLVTEEVPEPLRLSTLVVLSSRPSLVRDGLLSDEHVAREIGPKGRLTRLLEAADRDGTSFAVDPALVTELQTMQGGYEVLAGDGGTEPGTGQSDATRWLEDFVALKSERDGYRLLYGSPDIAALVRDEQDSVLKSAEAANRLVPITSALPLLVLPTDGLANSDTVEAAADLEPAAIVLSDSSARDGAPVLSGPEGTPIISFGSTAAEGGPGPDPRDTAIQVQQRSLTEAWIEAGSATSDGAVRGRVRVITTAAQARAQAAEITVPWMRRSTLADLLKTRPVEWEQKYRYSAEARADELTAGQLGSLRRFAKSQRVYADLLVEADKVELAGNAAVARAASGAWRNHKKRRVAFLDPAAGGARRHPAQQAGDPQQPEGHHVRPRGGGLPDHHPQQSAGRQLRPGRQRGAAPAGLRLRQPLPADHPADRGQLRSGPGRVHRRRRGQREGQRHRRGHRPVADREGGQRRPAVPDRCPGHPERDHRLGDRHRRRTGADRHHVAADPRGRPGAGSRPGRGAG